MDDIAAFLLGDLRKQNVSEQCAKFQNKSLTLDDDIPGLNGDLDPLGDVEQFLRVAIAQWSAQFLAI